MTAEMLLVSRKNKTLYSNLSEINDLQTVIMKFVSQWVRCNKTPIPRSTIVAHMIKQKVHMPTTRNALYGLIKKGYIREAVTVSNTTRYVALRSVS